MPYSLVFSPRARYELREVRLTRTGRNKLFAGINDELKHIADDHRLDPTNRDPSAPHCFVFGYLFRDGSRNGAVAIIVDDSSAAAGVLRVVSVADLSPAD